MAQTENITYRVPADGFFGELFRPDEDKYPGKALICFSGSDGGIELGISFLPGSSWSFHGKELPYIPYGMEKFPLGHILRKSIQIKDVTMYDLYLPLIQHPNPDAVIQVEKITGPVLLISSKMDTMWPSEPASEQIIKRLQDYNFPYFYQHLSYDYGGHMFVPMDLPQIKFFKGDRGKIRKTDGKPGWIPSQKHWNLSPDGNCLATENGIKTMQRFLFCFPSLQPVLQIP